MTTTAPYGFWRSPITSDLVAADSLGLSDIKVDGEDIYWVELRPNEAGRYVLVRRDKSGSIRDITLQPFSVRTRVHEYGGGAFAVVDGTVYFSNFADQRMYRKDPYTAPEPITPDTADAALRYADSIFDHYRNQVICVQEAHQDASRQVINTIVGLDPKGSRAPQVLVQGNDFYASPRLSPDGSKLAWLTWNHPSMPWTGNELWVGDLSVQGRIVTAERIAGGEAESIFQPEWSPDGILHFVSDRSDWWNLYSWENGRAEPLFQLEAEFGQPQWNFGMSTYAFENGRIICAYTSKGAWGLASLDRATRRLHEITTPYQDIAYVRTYPGFAVVRAGSPTEPLSIVQIDLKSGAIVVLRESSTLAKTSGMHEYFSIPRHIEFPTENKSVAYGFLYLPKNPDFSAPPDQLPPLLVKCHGGPTAAASSTLDLKTQYWTSRGIAVLDVDYSGSTGYGRKYREQLYKKWGVIDVSDCVNAAKYLVQEKIVDADRLAATGGSAGGYTTLCALTFHEIFRSGASYYGISDLEALVKDTHKFESHYPDWLVGPYPEARQVYYDRSPVHFANKLSQPVIFFQGAEDRIVPPNQTEVMVQALRERGLAFGYLLFAGEQHGFRRAENIRRALDAELYFYAALLFRSGLHF